MGQILKMVSEQGWLIGKSSWERPLQRQAMLVAGEEGVVRLFRIKVVTRVNVLALQGLFYLEGSWL